jgi:hypothetical protein
VPEQFTKITADRAHAVALRNLLPKPGEELGSASVGREALDRPEVSGRTLIRQRR